MAQQTRAHWRHRPIQHGEQRALGATATERFDELEIPARHLVERHQAVGVIDGGPSELRNAARLQLTQVSQQGTRGRDCRPIGVAHGKTVH